MNIGETKILEMYKNKGYQYLRNGWPDFVFYKIVKGKLKEIIFVEVKPTNKDLLSPAQIKTKNLIEKYLNLPYKIECLYIISGGYGSREDIKERDERAKKEILKIIKREPNITSYKIYCTLSFNIGSYKLQSLLEELINDKLIEEKIIRGRGYLRLKNGKKKKN